MILVIFPIEEEVFTSICYFYILFTCGGVNNNIAHLIIVFCVYINKKCNYEYV